MIMTYGRPQQAGVIFHLEGSPGNAVVTFAPDKVYQSVVVSSPELQSGSTYTLYVGGESSGNLSDGLYTGGAYRDGTEVVAFTPADTVTWLTESGVSSARTFGWGAPRGGGGRSGRR